MKPPIVVIAIVLAIMFIGGCSSVEKQENGPWQNAAQENSPKEALPVIKEALPVIEQKQTIASAPKTVKRLDRTLVVSGDDYLLDNTRLIVKGGMVVNESGKFTARNSEIVFVQDYNQQFGVYVGDATLDFENVTLDTEGKWFNFNYDENANIRFVNVRGNDCCLPWHSATDNANLSFRDSVVGVTLSQNVEMDAANSSMFIELMFSNSSGVFTFPEGFVPELDMEMPNEYGKYRVSARNSTFTHWGLTADKHSNITLIDSKVTIGMNAGSDWRRPAPKIKVDNLKAMNYDGTTVKFDTSTIVLKNTSVTSWYPQAWNGAVVEVSDSDLADVQFNGGNSTVIIRNSSIAILFGREDVKYYIYSSKIMQDVIGKGNSIIHLNDTYIYGKVMRMENSTIFIDGKKFE